MNIPLFKRKIYQCNVLIAYNNNNVSDEDYACHQEMKKLPGVKRKPQIQYEARVYHGSASRFLDSLLENFPYLVQNCVAAH